MNNILSNFNIMGIAVAFIPLLLGIILHEVAHGYAAYRFGDPTAKMLGRLTLNPIPHIDPMGLLAFIVTALASPFVFGWAKPVPVNARRLNNPIRDMMFVSFAGPLTNFILAIVFAVLLGLQLKFVPTESIMESSFWQFSLLMLRSGVTINLVLAWVNLLPIPPLDGSHILEGILPYKLAVKYNQLERYGFIILILLLFTNVLGKILWPLVQYSATLIYSAVNFIL